MNDKVAENGHDADGGGGLGRKADPTSHPSVYTPSQGTLKRWVNLILPIQLARVPDARSASGARLLGQAQPQVNAMELIATYTIRVEAREDMGEHTDPDVVRARVQEIIMPVLRSQFSGVRPDHVEAAKAVFIALVSRFPDRELQIQGRGTGAYTGRKDPLSGQVDTRGIDWEYFPPK